MTLPGAVSCRWCLALATGTVSGKAHPKLKATGPIPHCDAHWDNAYEATRQYPERRWQVVVQPDGLF